MRTKSNGETVRGAQSGNGSAGNGSQHNAGNGHRADLLKNGGGIDLGDDKEMRKYQLKMECFVVTPATKVMLRKMDDLFCYPTRNRMPCMHIVGDANSGKSSLLEKFVEAHPRFRHQTEYADQLPVVKFLIADATERAFYDAALLSMGAKVASSHNLGQKRNHFMQTCRELNVRLLVMDEFHNASHGTGRQQSKYCAFIKNVTNELRIPLIVAGTHDIKPFINSDSQLNSRFIHQMSIEPWQNNADYRGFLKALEKTYNLKKPSNLATDNDLAQKILDLTDGLTGEIVHLLEFAAVEAIDSGQEQITGALLDSLVDSEVWKKPSVRGP